MMSGGGACAIGPVVPTTADLVGVRYTLHLECAVPVRGCASAILFTGIRLAGPAGQPYLLEVSFFQWYPDFRRAGFTAHDIGCRGWPPAGRRVESLNCSA